MSKKQIQGINISLETQGWFSGHAVPGGQALLYFPTITDLLKIYQEIDHEKKSKRYTYTKAWRWPEEGENRHGSCRSPKKDVALSQHRGCSTLWLCPMVLVMGLRTTHLWWWLASKCSEMVSFPRDHSAPSSSTHLKRTPERGRVCGDYVWDSERSPMVVVVTFFVIGICCKNNLKLYPETWPASRGSRFLEMTTLLQLCWAFHT